MNRYIITEHGVKANSKELQTKEFQAVLDLCREGGGEVIVPCGEFYVSSLYIHSNTTLFLERGARIIGSDDCNDYEVFSTDGVEMRSDMELITQYYGTPWETYRRAIISSYGTKNISIVGEGDSVIDGQNCYDPDGEEKYRGPHAIFISCCENVRLENYTAQHSGNFLHEANNCKNLTMRRVTCLGGSDGIHLHCTENALIEDCLFKTGDDCIAGININGLHVNRCIFNTSCNLFRMGGINILVENCYSYGQGYYPHRKTIVKGKNDYLPREAGRHTTLCLVNYFASMNYPYEPSEMTFRNCQFDGLESVMRYRSGCGPLQTGTLFRKMTLENVRFTDLLKSSETIAPQELPFTFELKNVSYSFREGAEDTELLLIPEGSAVNIIKK